MANKNDELIKEYAVLSTSVSRALDGLEGAIKDMNDNNVLHANAITANTQAITDIKSFWGSIVKLLTIAIIILAGVEKIDQLMKWF